MINHPVNPAPVNAQTWTTLECMEQFEVHGFCAPFVEVTRKADGQQGSLQFNGIPRVYHSWEPFG